jgi:hypothetical protein
VAVAGSVVTASADDGSDVDLYVYAAAPVPIPAREAIADRFAVVREVGNDTWEPGDEWIDAESGIHVDVMYRTPDWIEGQLARVLVRHEASLGCSTCLWHNVLHSSPLVDRDGWYQALQAAARRPYPAGLKHAIVARNHPILRRSLSSYLAQIERAVRRGDGPAVQHRVTALLASYFDILFAVNELPHPGEKRLLSFAATRCARTPPHLVADVQAVLATAAHPAPWELLPRLTVLLDGLDALLIDEQVIRP